MKNKHLLISFCICVASIYVLVGCKNDNKKIIEVNITDLWWDSNKAVEVSGEEILKNLVDSQNFQPGPVLFLDEDTLIVSNQTDVEVYYCDLKKK